LVEKINDVLGGVDQYYTLISAIEQAQKVYREERTGFSGILNTLKNALGDFDMADVLAELQKLEVATE
jgi:hypothetical protein